MLLIPRTKPCLGIDRHQVRSGRFRIIKREIIQELLYPDGRWFDSPAVFDIFPHYGVRCPVSVDGECGDILILCLDKRILGDLVETVTTGHRFSSSVHPGGITQEVTVIGNGAGIHRQG